MENKVKGDEVLKKMLMLALAGFMAVSLCGCIAIMLLMSESAKEKQNFNIPYSQALDVVKGALGTLDIQFESADVRKDITEVKGEYADGRTIRILISKVSDTESSIAVRAGMSDAGKEDASKILKAITDYYSSIKQN